MPEEKAIKSLNRKYLIGYMLVNYLIFGIFSRLFVLKFEDMKSLVEKSMSPEHLIALVSIPLCVILEGMISSHFKHILVFLRFRNPLPSYRAFSLVALKDHRIDMKKVKTLFSSQIPIDPEEQNNAWYPMYRRHSSKLIVYQAHKSFLLTRDLSALTFILFPAFLFAHLIFGTDPIKILSHVGLLLFILVCTILASQNYGKRFVANVIVEELSPGDEV